jgi:hypothetical protein
MISQSAQKVPPKPRTLRLKSDSPTLRLFDSRYTTATFTQ